jgi:alpha-D-xyloside xylohydrolase
VSRIEPDTALRQDGLQSHGEQDIVMLPRAGWVGTWRHGAVLWSGDIGSTMTVLKSQVNIGISAQTSGEETGRDFISYQ